MPSYVAIDLKSFYASVECVERRLDPLTTNLVVADPERTEKTICLAVTPSLKSFNIPGRARLFEPEDNTTIHPLNLVEDENGIVYQFDATPFVGDGMGKVQKLSKPIYQEYVEVNEEIEFFVKMFIEIVHNDHYGLLTMDKINYYLKMIDKASTHNVLKGYCTKCLKILRLSQHLLYFRYAVVSIWCIFTHITNMKLVQGVLIISLVFT